MSLQFYFGPSGVGKSRQLYREIIERSKERKDVNFLIIVPDQFTMQTQKELVELHSRGGIMNIDVLSFGRLTHRVLEEVGKEDIPVLDDTGKSLVLQKVASGMREQLPCLGGLLHKQGYIHEVKSAISEFMQYGIGVGDMQQLIDFAAKRGALVQKLKDLERLYRGFTEYIQGKFITTEEKLDVLRRSLADSKLIAGSVIVFDGFTGFTPIQNRVIQELMTLAEQVIVTLTLGAGDNPYELGSEQQLFYLSKKTVADLSRLAKDAGVDRARDVFLLPEGAKKVCPGMEDDERQAPAGNCEVVYNSRHRFVQSPALQHLESHMFRYQVEPYEQETDGIQLYEATTLREEVRQCGLYIRRLVQEEGLNYRDIAVVTGDLQGYAPYVETELSQLQIPLYLDRTRGLTLNPMIEYIKSALQLFLKDFSYDSVFHFLRCGMTDIPREQVDALENYVLQLGLRGYRRWSRLFTAKTPEMGEEEEYLEQLNDTRSRFMAQVEKLPKGSKALAKDYVECLYEFLTEHQVQQKLAGFSKDFEETGELSRAREYAQIYRLVVDLLNQIYELLGEEEITLQEFAEILEAGFGEIQVGTIPQNVDRVVVGDMERTRLKQVKVLFFLGVNDGNIPKNASKGGIISDMDREFLQASALELAPTPRQQMFIQRLYLYLNMTKPSKRLYLSYAKMGSNGKALRPAYLIDVVRKLFPCVPVQCPENRQILEQIVTAGEGLGYLAGLLREYAEGSLKEDQLPDFFTVYEAYGRGELAAKREVLAAAAFKRYQDIGLSAAVARALYGWKLENSISRLETFAACAYHHFLKYGLALKERQEFGLEAVDLGNLYHGALERFAGALEHSDYTWFDFPQEYARETMERVLEELAVEYGNSILYSSERTRYVITRLNRVMSRTVLTLQNQLQKGSFRPEKFEYSFHFADHLSSVNVALSEQERMHLQGRIDRIDVAEDEEHVYVKIIDYKSGNKKFDLAALYYGLSLQLVVYMNAALELEKQEHPDKQVVPAALLYYHVEDPTIESPVELSPAEINEQILSALRMNGVVNSQPDIVDRLDREMGEKSLVVPVEKKKDGSFSSRSQVMSQQELQIISDYVSRKVAALGREILDGEIGLHPYEMGGQEACTYCPYRKVCGFDNSLPGCQKRVLPDLSKEELLKGMEEYGN